MWMFDGILCYIVALERVADFKMSQLHYVFIYKVAYMMVEYEDHLS